MWIIVYPLLDLTGIESIEKYSFVIALLLIGGLSMLINRLFHKLIEYDNAVMKYPILEEVFTDDIKSFHRRLKRSSVIESVTGAYFILTVLLSLGLMIEMRQPMVVEVAIFSFLAYGAVARAIRYRNAVRTINHNPTPQQCMETVDEVCNTTYIEYYNLRKIYNYDTLLSQCPRRYGTYRIVSIVFAIIAAILGCATIALGLLSLNKMGIALAAPVAIVMFLYGSLALYFGLKDAVSLMRLKHHLG